MQGKDGQLSLVEIRDLQFSPVLNQEADGLPLARLMKSQVDYFTTVYPPFVVTMDKKHELIGRHWSYRLFIESMLNVTQLPCLIFKDEKLIKEIIKNDKEEIKFLAQFMKTVVKKISKATAARHRAMKAGRICPICGDALMRPRGKALKDENGYYVIHCYQMKNKRCDFVGQLTEYEYAAFGKYALRTEEWLIIMENNRCKDCGRQMARRTLNFGDKRAIFECCVNYKNSSKYTCKNKKKIDSHS